MRDLDELCSEYDFIFDVIISWIVGRSLWLFYNMSESLVFRIELIILYLIKLKMQSTT